MMQPSSKKRKNSSEGAVIAPMLLSGLSSIGSAIGLSGDSILNSRGKSKLLKGRSVIQSTNEDGAVTFNPMHLRGNADSTVDGHNCALEHFEKFLNGKSFSALTEEEACQEEMFQKFATYLAFSAKNSRTKQPLGLGTCKQYLSSIKEQVKHVRHLLHY